MHLTPTSFVQQLHAQHEITREDIVAVQIVHALVKQYGARVLEKDILPHVSLDKNIVEFITFFKKTGLLATSALSKIIRMMKQTSWLMYTDIVSLHTIPWDVKIDDAQYHIANELGVTALEKDLVYKRTLSSDLYKML